MAMNVIVLNGRLVNNVMVNKTRNGMPIAHFRLAVDRNFKDRNGQRQADFFDCDVFGKRANVISQFAGKGSMVGVTGPCYMDQYTDRNGQNRIDPTVNVNDFSFISSNRGNGNGGQQRPMNNGGGYNNNGYGYQNNPQPQFNRANNYGQPRQPQPQPRQPQPQPQGNPMAPQQPQQPINNGNQPQQPMNGGQRPAPQQPVRPAQPQQRPAQPQQQPRNNGNINRPAGNQSAPSSNSNASNGSQGNQQQASGNQKDPFAPNKKNGNKKLDISDDDLPF